MERRAFLNVSSLALGTMLLPAFGWAIAAEELLKRADLALYQAKDAGRDQVIPAAPLMAGSAPTRSGTDAGSEASRQAHQPEPDDTLI